MQPTPSPERSSSLPLTTEARFDILLPIVAFAIPFFVASPQWLTGTLVNSFLFLAAFKLRGKVQWLVLILPSIAAVTHGALFGAFTPFLLFFLPFIWMGNWVLLASFSATERLLPRLAAVIVGALCKTALLSLSALGYYSLHLVPALFLQSMGLLQLLTALAGGVLALAILPFASAQQK